VGRLEDITQRIKASDVMGAVATEFFPEVLAGFLLEYLDGVSAKEFYHKVKEIKGKSLLGYLDPGSRAKLRGMVPDDLDWLNVEWFIKEIWEEHPDIAGLILSSQYIRNEIQDQINLFKQEMA